MWSLIDKINESKKITERMKDIKDFKDFEPRIVDAVYTENKEKRYLLKATK